MPILNNKKNTLKSSSRLVVTLRAPDLLPAFQKKQVIDMLQKKMGADDIVLKEEIDTSLLGGFQIQIGSSLLDVSTKKRLDLLQKALEDTPMSRMSADDFEKLLKGLVKEDRLQPTVERIGQVISVKDGIVRVQGMRQTKSGEMISFPNGLKGLVFNLSPEFSDVVLLGDPSQLQEHDTAIQTGDVVKVPVGKELLGRVVDALGNPIDGGADFVDVVYKPVEASVPGIIDRQPVKKPFQTGLKVIDTLIPIGLGQRELIVGDRQTGKTSMIIDAVLNQRERNKNAKSDKEKVFCIYVAVGQKQSTVAEIVRTLDQYDALSYTIVVTAAASDMAALQYLAPFSGCTMGEFFRDNGMNAVVFFDDLSKHANAYRQISLLLRRPPGREAYPGDIFYLHSRLLERAAMMSEEKGGGSLTAIPVVETQEGDVSAYIPTNVISITDGQIFLENALFHQGIRPAVNVGLSVSRVGSNAQRPLLAKMASSLKLDLAQYREMLSFAQIASDLDVTTQNLLKRGVRLTELLKQKRCAPLSFVQEYVCVFAGVNGFLEMLETSDIGPFESMMLERLALDKTGLYANIDSANKLTDELRAKVTAFIQTILEAYLEQKAGKGAVR